MAKLVFFPLTPGNLAIGSLVLSLAVLGLKYLAYALTGSIALYSDALESIVNVTTAALALVAIRVAAIPADDNHPYGHHKAEYLSAVAVGVLITLAALAIFHAAWQGLINPQPLQPPAMGLLVSTVASALNAGWSWLLITQGRKQHSAALEADGRHLFTDVLTSAGVFIGILLVVLTGWQALDSILAALVALHVLRNGYEVIRGNIGVLMDEALPEDTLTRLQTALNVQLAAHPDKLLEVHDLRTRRAGHMVFVDFHLIMPGNLSVHTSHALCDALEKALKDELRGEGRSALISIHVEPEHKAKKPRRRHPLT